MSSNFNLSLPPLSPAKARSTIYLVVGALTSVVSFLGAGGPGAFLVGLFPWLVDVVTLLQVLVANGESVADHTENVIDAINYLILTIAVLGGYLERLAPSRRIDWTLLAFWRRA